MRASSRIGPARAGNPRTAATALAGKGWPRGLTASAPTGMGAGPASRTTAGRCAIPSTQIRRRNRPPLPGAARRAGLPPARILLPWSSLYPVFEDGHACVQILVAVLESPYLGGV